MITPSDLLAFAVLEDIQLQSEATIRRAVSAAYYAAFHAAAQAGADMFSGSPQLRQRLARSYEHGSVRTMASEMDRHGRQPGSNPKFSSLARQLLALREMREVADYDLQASLTWKDGLDSIILATEALDALAALRADPAFGDLILLPLLRDRSRRG